jgi:hypothetical protein
MKNMKNARLGTAAALLIMSGGLFVSCPMTAEDDATFLESVIDSEARLDLAPYIPQPAAGTTPVRSFAASTFMGVAQWTATGDAEGDVVTGPFNAGNVYRAAVTLYAREDYTFTAVEEFRYGDKALTPLPDGTNRTVMLEIYFPAAGEEPRGGAVPPASISLRDLSGAIPLPVTDETAAAAVVTGEYVGLVGWEPPVSGVFADATAYTAAVNLFPLEGFTFGDPVGNFSYPGLNPISAGNGDGTVTVTITFPPTDRAININTIANMREGTGWSFADGLLTIERSGSYTITGTGNPTANHVVVAAGVEADIILRGVNIDVSGTPDFCAFDMTGAEVNLILASGSQNTLKSGGDSAGLQAPGGEGGSTLVITSAAGARSEDGTLTVYGGPGGAGIGGGSGQAGGTITINGGTINATGSTNAGTNGGGAGIGGGWQGNGGVITISGGAVTAVCAGTDYNAAGIGGGGGDANNNTYDGGAAGEISISGGRVTANGGAYGAGIGSGYTPQSAGVIRISGGTVTARGGAYSAGIGGGNRGAGGEITIDGSAVVDAAGGSHAAAIGGGYLADGGRISIGGSAAVDAAGGSRAAGIGGGYEAGGGQISIGDSAAVYAASGGFAAGIGAGYNLGSHKTNTVISISGGMVTAYTSGMDGQPAGIGGVGNNMAAVTISSGTVLAFSTEGAGIGAGSQSGGAITISGGTIIASKDIGAGAVVQTRPEISGTPVIFSTGIYDHSSNPGGGITLGDDVTITQESGGRMGTVRLNAEFTIPYNASLIVPTGWTVIEYHE